MNILFVTTQLPWPPVSGGVIKSWKLIEHWSKTANLSIICFLKGEDAAHEQKFTEQIAPARFFGLPMDRKRSAVNLLKSYATARTLNVYRNQSRLFGEKVEEWLVGADILFIDHYEMGQYIPKNFSGKVVLHQHNAEFVMWKRLCEMESNPVKKLLLAIEWRRIANTEKYYAGLCDLVLAAPNDITELVQIGVPPSKCRPTYHLGEDEMLEWPPMAYRPSCREILYIGTLTWEANIDGLLWWFQHAWPIVKQRIEGVKLTIVGKKPDSRLLEATAGDNQVHFTGFVEDLRPYYDAAAVFIIPLRFGSGIKVKLLNALYRGLPVVTTPIGTEGLDIQNETDLCETSKPEAFADYVVQIIEDPDLWSRLSRNGRAKARKYSWESLLKTHDAELKALIEPE